jgi:hypothetical protein
MEKDENNNLSNDTDYRKNVSFYLSWLPFYGLLVSIFTALFMLLKGREWSLALFFYTLIPIIGFLLFSLFIWIPLRKILYISLPYFKGKLKFLTFFLIIILVAFEIMIFVFNPK